jgi:hypothetical protein
VRQSGRMNGNRKETEPVADLRSTRKEAHPAGAPEEEPPLLPSSRFAVKTALQILLLLIGVAAALWILYRLRGLLLLLVLSVFFAYLVAPIVGFCRRPILVRERKLVLPLPAAIGGVYVLIFGSLAAAFVLLLPVLNACQQLPAEQEDPRPAGRWIDRDLLDPFASRRRLRRGGRPRPSRLRRLAG